MGLGGLEAWGRMGKNNQIKPSFLRNSGLWWSIRKWFRGMVPHVHIWQEGDNWCLSSVIPLGVLWLAAGRAMGHFLVPSPLTPAEG